MAPATVLMRYEQLPDDYKQEASDFIEFLLSKANQNSFDQKPLKRDGLGSLKGQIKMSDDFDEPLEEFREYM
jgi:hypothetical protein